MTTQPFNRGWQAKAKQNPFLEMAGMAPPPVSVTLPHDALIGTERSAEGRDACGYFHGGIWLYTNTLHVPTEWRDQRVSLLFEGVFRDAMVFVNGDFAAAHAYGYTEFVVSLDPFLRYGADNEIKVECRAYQDSRWYSGAGIFRDVHLVVTDPLHLGFEGVTITTPEVDADGALVAVATQVVNESLHTRTARVHTELVAPDGTVVGRDDTPVTVRSGDTATLRQRIFVAHPLRWSAETPHLYTCVTRLTEDGAPASIDDASNHFGIRTLSADAHRGMRVNGEVVKLRGACVHHDNGPIGAATIARADERRVEIMKAAGFNALRSAHQPMSRAMLDACDRLGMYVMDEAFDVWTESKSDHDYANRFADSWRDDVAAMVRKDRNRPSVVMYSIGNEITEVGSPIGAARGREISELIHSLDPTRFVTNAVQPLLAIRNLIGTIREQMGMERDEATENAGVNTQMTMWEDVKDRIVSSPMVGAVTEETFATADIGGYNYLDVRYGTDHEQFPNRVMVGSETYITAIARNWPTIMESPHVIGDFTWTGWDYLGEVGIGRTDFGRAGEPSGPMTYQAPFPWIAAWCGDIDIIGVRRPASYFREIVFGLRSAPYIAVHRPHHHGLDVVHRGPWSWSDSIGGWSWLGFEGKPITIDVYSHADEVELLCNERSLGRRATGRANAFLASFEATYEPGGLVAVAYTDGVEVGRHSLTSAVGVPVLTACADRSDIRADDSDLAYVSIAMLDAAGNWHHTADRDVTVTIDGPAVLQGLASGNPRTEVPYTSSVRATFDGQALAVVRPTGAGRIVVTVTADGCASVSVEIDAR